MVQVIKKKKSIIYCMAFGLYLIASILSQTILAQNFVVFNRIIQLLRYASYGLCFANILINFDFKDKGYYIGILFIALMALDFYFSKTMIFFTQMIMLVGIYKCRNQKDIIKLAITIQFFTVVFVVISSLIGLNEDVIFIKGETEQVRHGLGFVFPNYVALYTFFFTLEYLYMRYSKIRSFEYIVLIVLNMAVYFATISRFPFLLGVVAIVFVFLMKKVHWIDIVVHKLKYLCIASPFIIAVGLTIVSKYSDPAIPFWGVLNQIFSHRLLYNFSAIREYGIHLFGQPIVWIGHGIGAAQGSYNFVDCSYIQILVNHGIIILGCILSYYSYIMYKAYKNNDTILVVCLLLALCMSIFEERLMNIMFNLFPLFLFVSVSNDKISNIE